MKMNSYLIICAFMPSFVMSQLARNSKQPHEMSTDLSQYTTDLINGLLPKSYNKNLRPQYGEKPVQVNISLLITDISDISETSMDYKVDFYIRHYWHDNRLSFAVRHNITQVTLGDEFVKRIWLPDTYFENGKDVNIHKTISSEGTTLLRIAANGDLIFSTRIALLARCPMDLTFFPVDQQKCSLEISSYGLLDSEMTFNWVNDYTAVSFHPEIYLPSFHLIGYNKFKLTQPYSTGNYSRLQCDFYLSRSIGYYVSQVYVPAFLIVVISWVPFWLDQDDHHARVALGVTTVLTMTTLVTSTNSDFSKISHLKAIDIYLFTSFLMVFLALLEYANVGYYQLKCCRVANRSDKKPLPFENASIIDYWARRIFPLTFASFNVIYISGLYLLVSVFGKQPNIQVRL